MITEVKVGDLLGFRMSGRQHLCVVVSSYVDGMNRESFDVIWITDEANTKEFITKHYLLSSINKQKYADWRKVS